jgi:competence protein ComEA
MSLPVPEPGLSHVAARAAGSQPPAGSPATNFHLVSYFLGLTTALLIAGGALWLLNRPDPPAVVLAPPPTPAPTATSLPTATPAPIAVFVSGEVGAPGLYELAPGARIGDALVAAGGLLPGADPAAINQAQQLWDGAQLHVGPAPTATPALAPLPAPDAGPAVAPVVVDSTAPATGLSLALPTPTPLTTGSVSGDASDAGAGGGLVNLNSATAAELDSLPGIGPSKAQAIIDNRPFATVDELDSVPGIGASTLEQLRPLVTAP